MITAFECECGNELRVEMDTIYADGVDLAACPECDSVYEHRRFPWHTWPNMHYASKPLFKKVRRNHNG